MFELRGLRKGDEIGEERGGLVALREALAIGVASNTLARWAR